MCIRDRQYSDPSSALYEKAFLSAFPNDFASDVAKGTLPQVSWIVAPTVPKDHSEHPPAPPALGEWFTHQVLNTLVSNPKVWAKTVLFVSYDENDGFFDHVAPPTPPPGTPGEYLTSDPLPAESGGITGPNGLGFRVPLLVLSPFSLSLIHISPWEPCWGAAYRSAKRSATGWPSSPGASSVPWCCGPR